MEQDIQLDQALQNRLFPRGKLRRDRVLGCNEDCLAVFVAPRRLERVVAFGIENE